MATGSGRPLRLLLWSLALLGGVAAVFAVLDATHVYEIGVRFSPEVAGLFESSISLGQVLLLTLGATGALVLAEKPVELRAVAGALFALEVVALALSSARGAEVSFVVALALLGVWQAWPRMSTALRRSFQVAAGVLLVMVAGFIAYGAVVGPQGPGMARFQSLLTDRLTIWHSAAAHVPANLLLGSGTDRFSAVITWAVVPGGGLPYTITASPHNVVLDWLIAGGLVAAAGMIVAFVLLARLLIVSPQVRRVAFRAVAVGVAGWALSLLLSWVDPLSLAVAGASVGVLLATPGPVGETAEPHRRTSPWGLAIAALLVLAALFVAIVGARVFPLESSWARESAAGGSQVSTAVARYDRWPDPAFASDAIKAALASGDVALVKRLNPAIFDTLSWNAETNVLCAQSSAYLAVKAPPASPPVAACIAAGRAADPTSGIWDAIEKLVSGR